MFVHHKNSQSSRALSRYIQTVLPAVVVTAGVGIGYLIMSFILGSSYVTAIATDVANPVKSQPAKATLGAQTTATPQTTTTPPAPAASPAAAKAASCTIASYNKPAAPVMPTADVHVQTDAPTYYTVGTDNAGQLIDFIHGCARKQPGTSGYDAITSYNMSWAYNVTSTEPNVCKLTDVRVGMRINQLLPTLDSDRPAAVQTLWQSSSARLYSHEQQHAAIDAGIARSLYGSLTGLRESCQTINQSAERLTQSYVNRLHQDNDEFDAATNHGLN